MTAKHNRDHLYKLTARETEVVTLMSQALSNREIAETLGIGVESVRMHAKNLYSKLDVSGRQKASLKAIELGIIQTEDHTPTITTSHNLPIATTPFIGREKEIQDITHAFQHGTRLVTILGAGGMGKTRLSLAYGEHVLEQYSDGVYFVPLDAVETIDGILLQLIEILNLKVSNKSSYQQQLLNILCDKHMLLIIDNWEHLLDGATLISDILATAPDIHIIATSREKLSLAGELVFRLGGLSLPTDNNLAITDDSEAVQLIQETAQRIIPGWQITDDKLHDVRKLCQITDGMPLGIILAISWLDVYPLSEINHEIQTNLNFLHTELRDVPRRHRNIESVFEWTWKLLSPAEQNVFMKLSIFRNGCTLEAIEAITGATPRDLQALVRKALVYRSPDNRYTLHELLRQYGEAKLADYPQVEQETRKLHAIYYADVADRIMSNQLTGAIAEIELENLYTGWRYIVTTQELDLLWQCINSYGIIAYQLGCLWDMKLLFDFALETYPQLEQNCPELFGGLLFVNSSIHAYLNNSDLRNHYLNAGFAIYEGMNLAEQHIEVTYFHYHAVLAMRKKSMEMSLELLQKLITILNRHEQRDDPVYQTMMVYAHSQQAYLITESPIYASDTLTAKRPALKALQMAKQINHKTMIAFTTSILGERAFLVRNLEQATQYFVEADQAFIELNSPYDHANALVRAGATAFAHQHYPQARDYLQRSLDLMLDFGHSPVLNSLISIVARWKYERGDIIGATELIAYINTQDSIGHAEVLIAYFWGTFAPPLTEKDLKLATERGQMLTLDDVLRELYSCLEE